MLSLCATPIDVSLKSVDHSTLQNNLCPPSRAVRTKKRNKALVTCSYSILKKTCSCLKICLLAQHRNKFI